MVLGHVYITNKMVFVLTYVWHMPFFFLLSGYLFRARAPSQYFGSKVKHLLVPYLAYLVLLTLPTAIKTVSDGGFVGLGALVARQLYGGRVLRSEFATFWFISVLFLTQQLANLLVRAGDADLDADSPQGKFRHRVLWLFLMALAIAGYSLGNKLGQYKTPWNIDVLLVSLPVFFIGMTIKRYDTWVLNRPASLWIVGALLGLAATAALWVRPFNMKESDYGTPVCALAVAIVVFLALRTLRWQALPLVGRGLAVLGEASMTIMYLHPVVFLTLARHEVDPAVQVVLSLAMPLAIHHLASRWTWSARLLLGAPASPHHHGAPVTV